MQLDDACNKGTAQEDFVDSCYRRDVRYIPLRQFITWVCGGNCGIVLRFEGTGVEECFALVDSRAERVIACPSQSGPGGLADCAFDPHQYFPPRPKVSRDASLGGALPKAKKKAWGWEAAQDHRGQARCARRSLVRERGTFFKGRGGGHVVFAERSNGGLGFFFGPKLSLRKKTVIGLMRGKHL